MIALWIPITVAAAVTQCARTALQQKLKALLSTNGAAFVRHVYGAPIAIVMMVVLIAATGLPVPEINLRFLAWCTIAGIAQIAATSLMIWAFSLGNFAVGTTYAKTETIQAALFGTILLGEPIGLGAWAGIVVSLMGVAVLSTRGLALGPKALVQGWTQKVALVGLASGGLFAISAIGVRASALSLDAENPFVRAVFTLMVMNTLQTLYLGTFLAIREPGQVAKVIKHWRSASIVGFLSVSGSAGWFIAMTLQNVALVRALGQVELIFTFLASRYFLHERPTPRDFVGSLLVVAGVLVLLMTR